MGKKRKVIMIVCSIFLIGLLIIQTGYLTIGKAYHFEYVIDCLFYIVNNFILILGFIVLFLLLQKKKIAKIVISIVFGILFIFNTVFMIKDGFENKCIVQFSKNFKNELVLKQEKETGKTVIYKNSILLFARPKEQFPHTVQIDKIKTQWLTNDICSITYQDTNHKTYQYVATYGDRGNGVSYYYVASAIIGKWDMMTANENGKHITVDETGITITSDGKKDLFTYDDCTQYGTLAIVLTKNDVPKWTIALDENCNVQDRSNLVNKEGNIILCEVSMEKTASYTFFCTTQPYYPPLEQEKTSQEKGQELADAMQNMINQDTSLSTFHSKQDAVKVTTDSTDLFYITRLAREENAKQFAINGCDLEVQINQLSILAGDENEYLVKINATETATSIDQNTKKPSSSETTQMEWIYRIKKSGQNYLAVRVGYQVDGTVRLTSLENPIILDTSNNKEYHFFVPAI